MKHFLYSACIVFAVAASSAAFAADNEPRESGKTTSTMSGKTSADVTVLKVDVVRVASGYRASEMIGRDVYNDAKEQIGEIDDLVIRADDQVVYAIVSIGGFLGIGERLIAVPYGSFAMDAEGRVTLADTSKDDLKNAPEFKYRQ
tara:strand:- start:122 stop:556 length:435 start_codon:yes stop_codon:yes gene_type:complete